VNPVGRKEKKVEVEEDTKVKYFRLKVGLEQTA